MRGHLATAAALLVALACGVAAPADRLSATQLRREDPLRLTHSEAGETASLEWREGTGTIALQVVEQPDAKPSLPMARRAALWRPLLQRFFAQHGRRDNYLVTVGAYPGLDARLAAAAACSASWDSTNGRPRQVVPGDVADWLKGESLYRELHTLFAELNYRLAVARAESIVVCRWADVATEVPCGRTVPADAQVPCGASLVFQITAIP